MTKHVRAGVVISGKVQGVYFRAETQRAAMDRKVNGWVKNRPDGTVEALFEGDEAAVNSILEWCWQGSRFSRVAHVEIQWGNFTGDFDRFEIIY
jgi:acylphosphatase